MTRSALSVFFAVLFAAELLWLGSYLTRARAARPAATRVKASLSASAKAVLVTIGFALPIVHVAFTILNFAFPHRYGADSPPSPALFIVVVVLLAGYFSRELEAPSTPLWRATALAYSTSALFVIARLAGWLVIPYASHK